MLSQHGGNSCVMHSKFALGVVPLNGHALFSCSLSIRSLLSCRDNCTLTNLQSKLWACSSLTLRTMPPQNCGNNFIVHLSLPEEYRPQTVTLSFLVVCPSVLCCLADIVALRQPCGPSDGLAQFFTTCREMVATDASTSFGQQ